MSAKPRTAEQLEWVRDRFKPDGLLRLAASMQDYYDSHGHYLPDVAALAYVNGVERDQAEREARILRETNKSLRTALASTASEREQELTNALRMFGSAMPDPMHPSIPHNVMEYLVNVCIVIESLVGDPAEAGNVEAALAALAPAVEEQR